MRLFSPPVRIGLSIGRVRHDLQAEKSTCLELKNINKEIGIQLANTVGTQRVN